MAQQYIDTCFNYCTSTGKVETGFFSSDELRWINKIRKLASQYPNEVIILKQPEDNDGCIYAKVPHTWLKIIPPRVQKELSEEEKAVIRERLGRSKKKPAD